MQMPLWLNWQTHIAQNDARATSCRFDSDQRHISYYRKLPLNPDKELRAYVIGLAIGDGNLSNPNGRAVCLRITCDDKYIKLRNKVIASLASLFPKNKVGIVKNQTNCSNVYVHSNQLEDLLGWKAKGGSKFKQQVSTPIWIKESNKYIIPYLRGLIETDGSIYSDRGYPMMMFTSIIKKLAEEVKDLIEVLGFKAKLYTIKPSANSPFNQQILYHVRLSRDVQKFLDLVQPDKS